MWTPELDGLGLNIASDLIANIICVGVPVLLALGLYVGRRRRRLGFFGVTGRSSTVQILLSNIWVKTSGTLSPTTTIGAGFVGSAITATEYEYALRLSSRIQSQPFAGILSALAEQLSIRGLEPTLTTRIAPSADYVHLGIAEEEKDHRPIDFETDHTVVESIKQQLRESAATVLVGSTVYNLLTHYVLTHCGEQSRVEFVESPYERQHFASAINVKRALMGGGQDMLLPRTKPAKEGGVILYEEYFVVQKITNWQKTGITIFICAGTSTAATAAAVEKLAEWQKLRKRFRRQPFVNVYKLLTTDRDMPGGSGGPQTKIGDVTRVWPLE